MKTAKITSIETGGISGGSILGELVDSTSDVLISGTGPRLEVDPPRLAHIRAVLDPTNPIPEPGWALLFATRVVLMTWSARRRR